jgi:hypothetical protein
MIDDVVAALSNCCSEEQLWREHIRAEEQLTPLELSMLFNFTHRLRPQTRDWLKTVASYAPFVQSEPQRFCREPVATDIDIYRDPVVPSGQKILIAAFCGAGNRLMMPIPCTLQHLPSDVCDMLLVRDRSARSYTQGVADYAPNFLALVQKLATDVGFANYRKVFCYGTSMGAFPALRCGILLKADGAISVGGRFLWHPVRLLKNEGVRPVFDPLCDCNSGTTTSLVCCYTSADVWAADQLASILPVQRYAISSSDNHNVIIELWQRGELKDFYERIFQLYGGRGGNAEDGHDQVHGGRRPHAEASGASSISFSDRAP